MTQNNPIYTDADGNTPLHIAARSGDVKKMNELINYGADIENIDTPNNKGQTALHLSAAGCHVKVVKLLLENKANPNLLDNRANDALDYSTSQDLSFLNVENIKNIEELINAGANVNRTQTGMTPLMSATAAGHIPTIELLLEKKADINKVIPNNGRNSLIFAAEHKQWSALNLLLERGASDDSHITLQGSGVFGKNALKLVALSGSTILPENQLAFNEMFRKLLDRSDKIDIKFFINPKNNIPDYIKDSTYKYLILHGYLNLEHLNTGVNDDIAVNNIIGHVMFKAIKSTTKAELDAIELRDPERYEKIKKSGFHTLIKLNFICATDDDNDVLIKTAIKHGGDFIVFCREFEKMIVNKKMIKDLLSIEPSKPQEASANIEPSTSKKALTPQEASLPLSLLETITSSQLVGHLIFEKLLPSQLRKDLHKQNQVPKLIDSFLRIYYNKINSAKMPDEIKATTPNPIPRFSFISTRQGRRSASPSYPSH